MNNVDEMRLSVIGIGRLGLCFALNLERCGYSVLGYDIREDYVDSINNRTFRATEPGLNTLIKDYENFHATTDLKGTLDNSDVMFVVLRTESDSDGKYNHDQIESFIESLISHGPVENKHFVLCSNVNPGYTETIASRLEPMGYVVSFNPECVALGTIIHNQRYPDAVYIGESNSLAGDIIERIYSNLCVNTPNVYRMSRTEAELTKVSLNCTLTAKISMANLIGDVALKMGCDPDNVLSAVGGDDRINSKYFKHGHGYGGPCFPRDNRAFIRCAEQLGIDAAIHKAADKVNEDHLLFQVDWFEKFSDKSFPVTINQVSYKIGCDSIEESQQLEFAVGVAKRGFDVIIKETQPVIDQVKDLYGDLFTYEVVSGDALLKN